MPNYTAEQKRQALEEAGELLATFRAPLPRNDWHRPSNVIRVRYPRRFPKGRFVIAATIPLQGISVRKIAKMSAEYAEQDHQCELRIINGAERRCLRLVWRFSNLHPDQHTLLLRYAQMIARHTEEMWGMQAIISPTPGIVAARLALRVPA